MTNNKDKYLKNFRRKAYIKLQQVRIYNYLRDSYNKLIYGRQSPQYAEQLWIDPKKVIAVDYENLKVKGWGYYSSGKVIKDWPFTAEDYISVWDLHKIKHCVLRYKEKMSWEETGAYAYYKKYRITKNGIPKYTEEKIVERHRKFDEIFEMVKKENRLRTVSELNPRAFREESGILIHIGPSGELTFSETGSHRLGIALLLNIHRIPVQVGVVHCNAIPLLDKYRKKPKHYEH